jgi:hypothetical protein
MNPAEQHAVRRLVVATTIGSFSIAALMGILALLGSGDFGEGEIRVLLTTLIVGTASICVLCYLATGGTPYQIVGILGGAVVVLPLVTSLMMVWGDFEFGPDDGLIKAFGVGCVLAGTLAQLCLLLGLAWDEPGVRWLLWPTIALAAILAAIVTGMIVSENGPDGLMRLVGVVAILDVLGTVITVAMAKFGGNKDRRVAASAPAGPSPAGLAIGLPDRLAAAIEQRSRETGRSPAHLVAEAVERYLQQSAAN